MLNIQRILKHVKNAEVKIILLEGKSFYNENGYTINLRNIIIIPSVILFSFFPFIYGTTARITGGPVLMSFDSNP